MPEIKVVFKSTIQKYKEIILNVDTERTVEAMILKYLEKINRVNDMAKFRFLLGGTTLEKLEVLEKKVKNVPKIKPMCKVTVREVNAQIGGIKL